MRFPQANAIKVIALKPETSQKVQKISNRFWLAGILFSITNAVLKVSFRHALHTPSWHQLIVVAKDRPLDQRDARNPRVGRKESW
jgi:hypothetical protein